MRQGRRTVGAQRHPWTRTAGRWRRREGRIRRWRCSRPCRGSRRAAGRAPRQCRCPARLIGAELGREAVARPLARRGSLAAERGLQRVVLLYQSRGACPRRDGIHTLGERHADHAPDRVAGTPRPTRRLKLADQIRNLGRVEQSCEVARNRARCYFGNVHGGDNSLGQTPGDANRAGVNYSVTKAQSTSRVGRKSPRNTVISGSIAPAAALPFGSGASSRPYAPTYVG